MHNVTESQHILKGTPLTAPGFIQRTLNSGGRFTGSFTINELQYTVSGTTNPSVQMFAARYAVLEYTDLGQLTTTRSLDGQIGMHDISLSIDNGAKITAKLDNPVNPASTISGTGTWTQF